MLQSQQGPLKFSFKNVGSSCVIFYPLHCDSWTTTRCSRGVFDLLELEGDSLRRKKKKKTPTKLFSRDQSHFIPPCSTPPISLEGDKRRRDFIPTEPEQLRVRTVEIRFEYSCNREVFGMLTRQSFYIVPDRPGEEKPQSYAVRSDHIGYGWKLQSNASHKERTFFRFCTTGLFTCCWL